MFFGGGATGRVLLLAAVVFSFVPAGRHVARFCSGMVVAAVVVPGAAAAKTDQLYLGKLKSFNVRRILAKIHCKIKEIQNRKNISLASWTSS